MSFVDSYQLDMILVLEVIFFHCFVELLRMLKLFSHLVEKAIARRFLGNL